MIEIEFDSMEEAAEAVRELSHLGKARIDKRTHQEVSRKFFLHCSYEKALHQLDDALRMFEEDLDDEDDENLVEYLCMALTVLKRLYETGRFRELEEKASSDVEKKLLEIVSEMDFEDRNISLKFEEYKKLSKEANELFENMIQLPLEESELEEDEEELDSPVSGKPDELHPDDSSKEEKSKREDENASENDNDSLPPGAKYFNKIIEIRGLKQYLLRPIIESVYFHMKSEDPYSCFMDGVYLDIGQLPDLFDASDFRIRMESNIYIKYFLTVGIEFILQMEDFMETLNDFDMVNEDVFEEVKMVSIIADQILSVLEKNKKVKYAKFMQEITEKINGGFFCFEDIDVEFSVDPEFIELIIKDLSRIGFIKTKGKKIIRYAGK
ncbi:MAG: hypothetical protein HVN35_10740 [Methanobacteriaceae archaeon]|nr:hypothetical protein [Methanobacteriaceae archaeon]